MVVTSVKRGKAGKIEATLADGTVIPTTEGALASLFLSEGRDLDEEQLAELKTVSARFLCRDYALEAVSRSRLSQKELREKLKRRGFEEDAAGYALSWLLERGYLNDENYAAAVAQHYASKGYGAGRVRAELSRRGVSRELWDGAVQEMPEPDDKLDRYITSHLKDPDDREAVRKISAALYRRGYSWDEIRSALNRCRAADPEEY